MMPVGPVLSPGQSQWTLCWAEALSASSSTSQWSGMGPASHYLARHRNFRSIWMVICWKWQPKQVGRGRVCVCEWSPWRTSRVQHEQQSVKKHESSNKCSYNSLEIWETQSAFKNPCSLQAVRDLSYEFEVFAERLLSYVSFCSWQLTACIDECAMTFTSSNLRVAYAGSSFWCLQIRTERSVFKHNIQVFSQLQQHTVQSKSSII